MRPHALLIVAMLPVAQAAVAVTVGDASSALGAYAPVSGADGAKLTTSDPLAFTNFGATERQLTAFTAAFSFTYRSNGSTATTTIPYQGVTEALLDLTFAAPSSSGSFLPLRLRTGEDLTGEPGWTKAATCGTVTYQGALTVPSYSNAGVAQAELTRYYQVCDATRIHVGSTKDLTLGDDAWIVTTTRGVTSTEAEHELAIGGATYVFASAGSATTVTLDQGGYSATPVPTTTTLSLYPLVAIPDGFPAGTHAITITATAFDITT